jgi:tetratricopeptide (TPR) repeat protein
VTAPAIGRNEPCPCGSGKRYKHCHGAIAPAQAGASAPPAHAGVMAPFASRAPKAIAPAIVDSDAAHAAAPSARAEALGPAAAAESTDAPAAPAESGAVPATAADALAARGVAAHKRNEFDAAERDYRAALAIAPEHPLALHYLGVVMYQRSQLQDALPMLERAATLAPRDPEVHNNLGLALAAAERIDDAIASYRRALDIDRDHAAAWNNLGLALQAGNDVKGAIAAFRAAIARAGEFAQAHWNLSLALLLEGEFADGWREYEWRSAAGAFGAQEVATAPRWDGGALRGRTLLLTREQGMGDALQFIRFAQPLAARGARVIVRADAALAGVLATAPGVAQIVEAGASLPPHDLQLPLLSAAGALGVVEATIPRDVPYLAIGKGLLGDDITAIAREVAGAAGALTVGLSWAGNPGHANDRRRSCPLAAMAPLFELPNVVFFSLQKDDGEAQIPLVPTASRIVQLAARNDFREKAALLQRLDLVLSVDTANAHLAGALGRPLWLLLPFAPDWRWGLARRDSPWYPTARIYRQPRPGDWASVIEDVRAALVARAG